MNLDTANIPTVSRQELRDKIKQDKQQYAEQQKDQQVNIDEPGTHSKELNPYWKSGTGTGQSDAVWLPAVLAQFGSFMQQVFFCYLLGTQNIICLGHEFLASIHLLFLL